MYKILVIDDDNSTRESLTMYLDELGYSVRDADNGLKALELIKQDLPDLVITDMKMSGLNGIELAYVIKGLNLNIPIIMVSSYDNNDYCFSETYFHAFLQKPLDIAALRKQIGTALRKVA
jgi:DNA-binding NtrC family response regulator